MPAPKLSVRQLSLQGTQSSPAVTHRGIRRQLSDNDFLNLRIGAESPGKSQERARLARPKPTARLAWTEPSEKETIGVEVVARRCGGLPRPVRPPQKDTIDAVPATREQLAERLRRAWRGRSRRTNLDIYLAHSRPESALSSRTNDDDIHIIATKAVRAVHPTTLHERNKLEINLGVQEAEESSSVRDLFHVRAMSFTKQDSFNKENIDSDRRKLSASERRASFKTSQLLNRTITGSFSDDGDDQDGFKVFLTRPPLLRTSSAPTERNTTTPQPPPPPTPPKPNKPEKKPAVVIDYTEQEEEKPTTRRKIKTPSTRRKPKERDESSDEEQDSKTKKLPRRRQIPRPGADIITMVSLVSPAESDTDEPQLISTGLLATIESAEPEPQPEPEPEATQSFLLQNLRKTVKTVSFQAHPPVSRSCSASFPMRRVPPGAPIIIPPPITTPTTGQDGRGIKRRMIRAKTAPLRNDEETPLTEDAGQLNAPEPVPIDPKLNKDSLDDDPDSSALEPIIKSPKEKECWVLYKKMVDKGVAVSYDTILRGMLTPTEYRLRQNQLSRR